ncbi:MAG: CotH kinase family protein [Firmicutes bacterium]|nr:CotH kinase family protein [Bacillota bacterium]
MSKKKQIVFYSIIPIIALSVFINTIDNKSTDKQQDTAKIKNMVTVKEFEKGEISKIQNRSNIIHNIATINLEKQTKGKSSGYENKPEITYDDKFKSSNIIIHEDIIIFPEPAGLIDIQIDTLENPLPNSKAEGDLPVMLKLTTGGASLSTYGKIKVQGSSTAIWPKKNWTLKFYSDEERTNELRLKIGNSIASDKWIAKAEWIDPTMLRNALSYRLWEGMVKSRKDFPQYEVDYAWIGKNNMYEGVQTGAQGFPRTYPAIVKVNGNHYGISLFVLGHDPRNFNIDKDNPKHMYMEFDARFGYTSVKTWDKFSAEGINQWIDGYHPKNEDMSEVQREAIDALGKLINGSLDNFIESFDKHLDKRNMIDMLLFMEAIYDWDAVAQDIEMVTYDLEKWYMLPWDKDTSFGLFYDGSGLLENRETKILINCESEDPAQKPWYKTYHAFKPEIEARYAELRNENIFSGYYLYKIAGEITKKIPKEIWEAERLRWEKDERPSLDETSTYQVISWFEKRLEMLDEHFNYKVTEEHK